MNVGFSRTSLSNDVGYNLTEKALIVVDRKNDVTFIDVHLLAFRKSIELSLYTIGYCGSPLVQESKTFDFVVADCFRRST
jgi:hypothetical protein